MGKKVFKTIDEQIEILQNKGLIIDDYDYTKDILVRENYFFLSGYRHVFMKSTKDNTFIPGTNFKELYGLFKFDRHTRNVIFKNLLIVENNIKSIISYVISKNYGYKESSYLSLSIFTKDSHKVKQVNDLVKKMKRQIRINGKQHNATKHYLENYGYLPLWVVVKVLSFGIVSELYSILKRSDQQEIADYFGLKVEDLLDYLPILSNYRNLCAHEDICFEHKSMNNIMSNKYHDLLSIPKVDNEYIYGINDMFALVIILKSVLRDDDFKLFIYEIKYELEELEGKLHTISIGKVLDRMGFPPNYNDIARI